MSVVSDALKNELDSPFYLSNKNFCLEVEDFILRNSGEAVGKYNAWSFLVKGKITTPVECKLRYSKATDTAIDRGLLTDIKMSVVYRTVWEFKLSNTYKCEFVVREKSSFDKIKSLFTTSYSIDFAPKYTVIKKGSDLNLLNLISSTLKIPFSSGDIFRAEFSSGLLKIEMNTDQKYFDLFEELIKSLTTFR